MLPPTKWKSGREQNWEKEWSTVTGTGTRTGTGRTGPHVGRHSSGCALGMRRIPTPPVQTSPAWGHGHDRDNAKGLGPRYAVPYVFVPHHAVSGCAIPHHAMPFCTAPCQTVPRSATLLPATLRRVVPRHAGPAGAVLLTCSSPALKSKHVPASRAQQSGSEHRADGPAVLAPR